MKKLIILFVAVIAISTSGFAFSLRIHEICQDGAWKDVTYSPSPAPAYFYYHFHMYRGETVAWTYCQVVMCVDYTGSQYYEDNLGLDGGPFQPYTDYYKDAWTAAYSGYKVSRITLHMRASWTGDYIAAALYW